MRKSFLLYVAAVMLVFSFIGTSCKKMIHSGAPTPNNERMVAYTKITTIKLNTPIPRAASTISENYRFYYDEVNRVTRMTYTGNDSFEIHKSITFTYKGDTIIKKTVNILNNVIVENDTFVMNSAGQITTAFTPNMVNTFDYFGKLLTRNGRTGSSYRNITITDFSTYTSVNGDFLKHTHDGNMKITLNGLTLPLKVMKILSYPNIDTQFMYQYNSNDYSKANTYRQTYVYVKDTVDNADSFMYPGQSFVNEGYHFYTEQANRTGDYLQLQSFTMYGKNIFQNSHLVESITSSNRNASIAYTIDAFNKITQTRVEEVDSVLNKYTTVYDIQYETY